MQSPPKELFLTILTRFLILDKIQDGGQDGTIVGDATGLKQRHLP